MSAEGADAVAEASDALNSTTDGIKWLLTSLANLTQLLDRTGAEMMGLFGDISLANLNEDTRAVGELLIAWREVGEAEVALAARLRELASSLREKADHCEQDRERHLQDATTLNEELRLAASGGPRVGWFGWLLGYTEEKRDGEAANQKLKMQTEKTQSGLASIVRHLCALRKSGQAAINDAVADVRKHSKAVSEKLTLSKPRCGAAGSTPTKAASATQQDGGDTAHGKNAAPRGGGAAGGHVGELIKALKTPEGRQQHQEAERQKEEAEKKKESERQGGERHTSPRPAEEAAPMTAPPVEQVRQGEWRIKGVYDHQVLKAGLRRLDAQWASATQGLFDLPRGKDGGKLLLRESLFRDLLAGEIELKSVPANDVSAAQSDLKRLSLPQLLRLRVHHIDYTPSGSGVDTVSSVGNTHEAFLATLDGLLFQQLGRKAVAGAIETGSPVAAGAEQVKPEDAHQFGRQAVLLYSAAGAVPAPAWWVWWLKDEHRVYFDAAGFASSAAFGSCAGGALEINDLSRPDRYEPTGKLRWLDWQVELITDEAALAPEPKRGGAALSPPMSPKMRAAQRGPGGAGSPKQEKMSSLVLREALGGLRKGSRADNSSPSPPRSASPDAPGSPSRMKLDSGLQATTPKPLHVLGTGLRKIGSTEPGSPDSPSSPARARPSSGLDVGSPKQLLDVRNGLRKTDRTSRDPSPAAPTKPSWVRDG